MVDLILENLNKQHSPEEIKSAFRYDQNTGKLYWKIDKFKIKSGKIAGTLHRSGYRQVMYKGVHYQEHRVIWCLVHGEWPDLFIDHIDRNRSNNRLENLRLATRSENSCNTVVKVNSVSGIKGVNWHKASQSWLVRLQINGVRTEIGRFSSIEEAKRAIENARLSTHKEFTNHG